MDDRTKAAAERAALSTLDATARVQRPAGAVGPLGYDPDGPKTTVHEALKVKVVEQLTTNQPVAAGDVLTANSDAHLWCAKGTALQADDLVDVTGDPAPWRVLGEMDGSTGIYGTERYRLTRDVRGVHTEEE